MATAVSAEAPSFVPANDGVDHINVYSQGATDLGRLLSNFAHTPFEVTGDGAFASVEAYWYWIQCTDVQARERLRHLYGYRAKQEGRRLRVPDYGRVHDLEFRRSIARAIRAKVSQTPGLAGLLAASDLPFAHYYIFGETVVTPANNGWIMDTIAYYRTKLQRSWADTSHGDAARSRPSIGGGTAPAHAESTKS